jgi:hypothetical protein
MQFGPYSINEARVIQTFDAYRIGRNPKYLGDRNVASLRDLVYFMDDHGVMNTNTVSKYEIKTYKQFGEYQRFRGAGNVKHTPDPDGEPVGKVVGKAPELIAYSLPLNGAWEYKLIDTVTIAQLHKFTEKFTSNKSNWKKMWYSPEKKLVQRQEMWDWNVKRGSKPPTPERPTEPEPIKLFHRLEWKDMELILKEYFK